MLLKNSMEICVQKYIDEAIKENNLCRCERCRLDVTALVLNTLPPKYVVVNSSVTSTKIKALELQFESVIQKEVKKAIEMVKKENRHDS